MAPRIANRGTRIFALALLLSALPAPSKAFAQPSDVARAEQLFEEGRALMKRGEYSRACARFEESQALDPGGGTILNLGICRRQEGRTATAHAVLREALEQARVDGRADRMATAQKHLDALAAVLSRVSVRVPANVPPSLRVEVDGEALTGPPESWTLPLDPGVHEVRASADGFRPWSVRVTLSPSADHVVVELPLLEPLPALEPEPAPPPAVVPPPPPLAAPPRREPAPPPAVQESAQPFPHAPAWLGYVLAGGGAAAIGAGTYFGVRALGLKSASDEQYDFQRDRCRTRACVEAWEDAKSAALASNVLLGLGALGLAGGAYFLLRPSSTPAESGDVRVTLHALSNGAAASASGAF